MSAIEYDPLGLPVISECPARHPETGNQCTEPEGHDGAHRAMGTQRLQLFGDHLQSGEQR